MNEAETRAEHIDPALKAAGWGVVEGSKILREYRITEGLIEGRGRRGKADIADYVLLYRNTKLGVVEAKALDEGLTEGVGQAKNYAGKPATSQRPRRLISLKKLLHLDLPACILRILRTISPQSYIT